MRVPKGLILAGGLGAVQALVGGVTAAAATVDAQGNYNIPGGCCAVRVMGYLADGVSYVNGSVRHAPTGVPATILVEVGPAAPEVTPTPTPSSHATAAPTARPATGTLAQTG